MFRAVGFERMCNRSILETVHRRKVGRLRTKRRAFHLPLIRLFDSGVEEQQKQSDYLAAPPPRVFIQLCQQPGCCGRRRDRTHDNIFIGHCRAVQILVRVIVRPQGRTL